MKKICVYGKGGIGKSMTVANIAVSMSQMGKKVAVVGCDPKADSTRNIAGKRIKSILDIMRDGSGEEIFCYGYNDIKCMESGGPLPATGCAGRGIVVALEEIKKRGILNDVDVVIYDVLGDVVCGGFATPLRENVADEVYIVSTSDYMSLYALNNICKGVKKYAESGSIRLAGVIHNGRSSLEMHELVGEIASKIGTEIIGFLPLSEDVTKAEMQRKTAVELFPESEISSKFKQIAEKMLDISGGVIPSPLSDEEVEEICMAQLKTF